jgi:hypothetical protein
MRKGVSGIQNVQLLKWCCELDVLPVWGILWGFPGEDRSDYAEMADLIPSLTHLMPPIGITPIRLDRFSPNFVNASEWGFSEVEPYPAYRYVHRQPDGAIRNLSYFFTYSYKDGRDTASYVSDITIQVRRWREHAARSALFFVDKGDCLGVVDLRRAASRASHALHEPLRSLYLACDEARPIKSLASLNEVVRAGWSEADIRAALADLVRSRLMMQEGERYLALAVQLGPFRPSREILACLGRAALPTHSCVPNQDVLVEAN